MYTLGFVEVFIVLLVGAHIPPRLIFDLSIRLLRLLFQRLAMEAKGEQEFRNALNKKDGTENGLSEQKEHHVLKDG